MQIQNRTCSIVLERAERDSAKGLPEMEKKTEASYLNAGYRTTCHSVFPGVTLIYADACGQSGVSVKPDREHVIEMLHCREGRMECSFPTESCYIGPDDLLIARAGDISETLYFPRKHYRGISVRMDIDHMPECLSCLLDDVTVCPRRLAEKFCKDKSCFIARANPSVAHIFSELYSVPAEIQKGYFKVKILELLLFLSVLDTKQDEYDVRTLSRSQVALAKEVSRYLSEHMETRITLKGLTEHFHMSGTYIKTAFRTVYGISLYAYIRGQKMESAAYMLQHTDKSVLEIAGAHGYDNGSKFASAFRDVKGMLPSEYRSQNRDRQICV